ncbi:hypothetical protein [Aeoliella mucimassa]|nr:hypothetical protein [Aeoliella mucimassa]
MNRSGPASTIGCLLISDDKQHRKILERVACTEGWNLDACVTVLEAMKLVFRKKYELAFVDIQSVAGSSMQNDYQGLAGDLSRDHVPLLIVNGVPEDPIGEITARQIGVWVYLPGFDGKTELDVLFREARLALKRLTRQPSSTGVIEVTASKPHQ